MLVPQWDLWHYTEVEILLNRTKNGVSNTVVHTLEDYNFLHK